MRGRGVSVAAWIVLLFLYIPVTTVVLFSLQGTNRLELPWAGPSIRWFRFIFGDPSFTSAMAASLKVGLFASVVGMIVGTMTGVAFTRFRLRVSQPLRVLALAPIALPGLFVGLSLLISFTRTGLEPSLVTVGLAHLIYVLPYVLIVVSGRLERFDVSIEEAARVLGATPWQTFRRITFPIIWPAILAGGVLAFGLSIDQFSITLFVIGQQSTLPIMIWSRMHLTIDPSVNAVATTLLSVFFASLATAALLLRIRGGERSVAEALIEVTPAGQRLGAR